MPSSSKAQSIARLAFLTLAPAIICLCSGINHGSPPTAFVSAAIARPSTQSLLKFWMLYSGILLRTH